MSSGPQYWAEQEDKERVLRNIAQGEKMLRNISNKRPCVLCEEVAEVIGSLNELAEIVPGRRNVNKVEQTILTIQGWFKNAD